MKQTFAALRAVMKKHAGKMTVVHDTDDVYYLDAGWSEAWKKNVFFGCVRISKNYVGYHLMPVYTNPTLLKDMSPDLRKRMQGKSCFNFKAVSKEQLKELDALTKRGVTAFKQLGQITTKLSKTRA